MFEFSSVNWVDLIVNWVDFIGNWVDFILNGMNKFTERSVFGLSEVQS